MSAALSALSGLSALAAVACLVAASACWPRALGKGQEHQTEEGFLLLLLATAAWVAAGLLFAAGVKTMRVRPGGEVARAVAVGVAMGATWGGVLAVPVSQYCPLFGGFAAALGSPWSPARLGLIAPHAVALAVIGAAAWGGLAGLVARAGR